jgi:diguanylate cyclase (GGDEF)-like protein
MANPTDALKVQEQLKALRKNYASELPEKIGQVEEAWREVQSKRSIGSLKALHLLIHKLTGSGATFGFTSLSEVARNLEIYLKSLIEKSSTLAEADEREIAPLLTALKGAAVRPDQDVGPTKPAEHSPADRPSQTQEDNKLILLSEGDSLLAQDLVMQISHFGYTVRNFLQPSSLKAAVDQNPPAAIIIDITSPKESLAGTQVISEIQKEREVPIPVIFISARWDLAARLQAVRAGGNAYFTRPIDINALVDKLDMLTSHPPSDPFRILIVEDEPELASHYALTLKQAGMIAAVVADPMQVMQPLTELRPDLILMDVYMPGCSGIELSGIIRQQEAYVSIPIVFLSTETDPDKQFAAMSLGGDDFLTKPIESDHLISSVTTRVQRWRTLRSFMTRDSLTGLLNHTKTEEQLGIEMSRAKRQKTKLAFAMIDIDHFKSVNDTYGHSTGDRVLKSLSRLLQQRLRKTDTIGRYGGEEFAAILPDTDGPTAVKVLDKIRDSFSQIRQQSEGAEFSATFSCGVAFHPQYGDMSDLSEAADKALYEAKRGGRNRVVLAS